MSRASHFAGVRGAKMLSVWMYKFCELFDESNCVVTP
jgi:hypothetical protein